MPFPKFLTSSSVSARRRKKKDEEDDSLRRRSLHGGIGGLSLPPVREEPLPDCCWIRSLSFEASLDNAALRDAFSDYLSSRPERKACLAFWTEIRAFKQESETRSIDSGYTSSEYSNYQRSDALRIYQKFVAPDSQSTVSLPSEITHTIIKGICSENPLVDPECFTPAENHIEACLSNQDFAGFLRSPSYAKYLLEGGSNSIRHIMSDPDLLSQFTEFLGDEKEHRDHLSFWVNVNHFHEDAQQGDALVIYERFVSMQAPSPLGIPSEIRSSIEEQICVQPGASLNPHLFDQALRSLVRGLRDKYLEAFLNSSLFINYINELKALSARRSASVTSLLSCSSDISTQNTLLAMSKPKLYKVDINGKILHNVDAISLNMDTSWDPNHIWRPSSRGGGNNMGEIDHLGRYISHFESPPPFNALSPTASSGGSAAVSPGFVSDPLLRVNGNSKLHRVMRVLGVSGGSEVPEVQEQLAWHEAEIIVKDVLNLNAAAALPAHKPEASSPSCDK